jgi:hypothetical protein
MYCRAVDGPLDGGRPRVRYWRQYDILNVPAIASAPVLSPVLVRFRAFANRDRGSVNEALGSCRYRGYMPAMRSEDHFLVRRDRRVEPR